MATMSAGLRNPGTSFDELVEIRFVPRPFSAAAPAVAVHNPSCRIRLRRVPSHRNLPGLKISSRNLGIIR